MEEIFLLSSHQADVSDQTWQDKEEGEEEADESDHIGTHFLETPEQQA